MKTHQLLTGCGCFNLRISFKAHEEIVLVRAVLDFFPSCNKLLMVSSSSKGLNGGPKAVQRSPINPALIAMLLSES